jgi:hypothetical protein
MRALTSPRAFLGFPALLAVEPACGKDRDGHQQRASDRCHGDKVLILERPVGYGVVPPNVPERIKEMGAARTFASRHAPTAIASKPKHFAVATVRPVAFGRSS